MIEFAVAVGTTKGEIMIKNECPDLGNRTSPKSEIENSYLSSNQKQSNAQTYLDDPLYDRKGAALYITPPQRKRPYSVGTLAVWDCTKRYNLQPIRINGEVYYRQSSLDRYLRERLKP